MNFLATVVTALPRRLALYIGVWVGTLAYYLMGARRKLALENFNQALGTQYSPADQKKIIKNVFINLSLNLIEFLRFSEINAKNYTRFITLHGLENLEKAHKQDKGVLILTSHMGNWEYLAATSTLVGKKGAILVKTAHSNGFNAFLERQRKSKNLHLFQAKNSLKEMLKFLKTGGLIGIVIDQHGIEQESVVLPFFGRPASTLKGLAVLAKHTGTPVIPAYIYRDKNWHHHVIIEPALCPSDESVEGRTLQYNQWLEGVITQFPDQWMWTHNRWKVANEVSYDIPK